MRKTQRHLDAFADYLQANLTVIGKFVTQKVKCWEFSNKTKVKLGPVVWRNVKDFFKKTKEKIVHKKILFDRICLTCFPINFFCPFALTCELNKHDSSGSLRILKSSETFSFFVSFKLDSHIYCWMNCISLCNQQRAECPALVLESNVCSSLKINKTHFSSKMTLTALTVKLYHLKSTRTNKNERRFLNK